MDSRTVGQILITIICLIFLIGVICIAIDMIYYSNKKPKIITSKKQYSKYEEYEISNDLLD